MATKRFAQGTKLYIGDGASPEVFTPIGHMKDISTPSSTVDLVDVTDHDSPNGRKEYISGLIDGDEMTYTFFWDAEDAVHDDVESRVGDNANFRIELNNAVSTHGTQYDFNAVIRKFTGKSPVNGAYEADITLKPSGDIAKTPAA